MQNKLGKYTIYICAANRKESTWYSWVILILQPAVWVNFKVVYYIGFS
jgi:hypothetical protein